MITRNMLSTAIGYSNHLMGTKWALNVPQVFGMVEARPRVRLTRSRA